MRRFPLILAALLLVVTLAAAYAFQAVRTAAMPMLASLLPPGAYLTIESPDFGAVLSAWKSSPQQAAWLQSADYSVFSNSRLFGRLNDAQQEFLMTSNLASTSDLLQQVAGTQAIFAWYDIGNLEFLYITRMPASKAARTELMQTRGTFSRRQVGDAAFYVKTGATSSGRTRTVAFATSGDWLLLATREDLMANALKLLQKTSSDSVATEPWFQTAEQAAKSAKTPDLHMVLNLDRLVRTANFRSYWIQQNVTEMGLYQSAVADLYREPSRFREERVLLPKEAAPEPAAAPANLEQLTVLVPDHAGFYRALASPDAAAAYATLEEKLLERGIGQAPTGNDAPAPDMTTPAAGDTVDLETRIDTPAIVAAQVNHSPGLQELLATSGLDASLTVESASTAGLSPWLPIHSAVVLRAAKAWDRASLEAALQADLQTHMTTGNLGLAWQPRNSDGQLYDALSGAKPLALAVVGNLCIVASDPALVTAILTKLHAKPGTATQPTATLIAGFDHASQRQPYLHLASLLDRNGDSAAPQPGTAPAFFSGDIGSLSNTFAAMQSEQIVERPDGANLHQTVIYQWQP